MTPGKHQNNRLTDVAFPMQEGRFEQYRCSCVRSRIVVLKLGAQSLPVLEVVREGNHVRTN